ncbi:META domain-containing protein [Porphyromonas levii]|uniref:META domain-containing protein n=1 Tax=Porphyromonas levii TaxID=28114 RepID=UPI000369C717|nr:META domain-containing protein [Porphyromonas levii]MBR8713585.1 hypothetical protein [Porphyromonas levii]MBR8715673.1 hypothetical protein [Porphyromonas levii]MBR8728188.1 hypothetical protein [Porphyromonas levii]MBR8736520.1 hypothetical protein [Porphyromonas levii]MBR8758775.1 hypothetical protein [Porphyromonas levii]
MREIVTLLAIVLLFGSCTDKHSVKDLTGAWNVQEASGFGINNPEAIIAIDPEERLAYGTLGCTPFSVSIDVEPGKLTLGEILTPFVVCDRVEEELVIKNSLNRVKGFEISSDGTQLSLLTDDDTVAVRLTRVSSELSTPPIIQPEAVELELPFVEPLPVDSLAGTWEVVRIGNTNYCNNQSTLPYVIFDMTKKEVLGHLGCNDFGAQFELRAPNLIRFKDIFSTRQLCEDMSKEIAMSFALKQVNHYGVLENGLVWLLREDDTRILLLRRKE